MKDQERASRRRFPSPASEVEDLRAVHALAAAEEDLGAQAGPGPEFPANVRSSSRPSSRASVVGSLRPRLTRALGRRDLRGPEAFLREYPDAAPIGVVLYSGEEWVRPARNIVALPWSAFAGN